MIASERWTGEDRRLLKDIREECMRLCSPEECDGIRNIEAIERFTLCLEAYLRLHSRIEESKVCSISLLEEARKRWLQLCKRALSPPDFITVYASCNA